MIKSHLDLRGAVDEKKVREIVDGKIAEARLPRPLDVRVNDVSQRESRSTWTPNGRF